MSETEPPDPSEFATVDDVIKQTGETVMQVKVALNQFSQQLQTLPVQEPIGKLFETITALCGYLSDSRIAVESEREKIQQRDEEIKHLKEDLKKLRIELTSNKSQLQKEKPNDQKCDVSPPDMEYHTDEEQLAEETGEWDNVIQRGHKRKKTSNSPQIREPTVKLQPKRDPKPPPVYIERVTSFPALKAMVEEQTPNVKFTTMSNDVVKINAADPDGFRAITRCFVDKKIPHYTYQNKQDRPIRVMIKGIHKSWPIEEVLNDLRDQFDQDKVLLVTRKLEWNSKTPLDMCVVDFKNDVDIDQIYKISQVLKGCVTVHPMNSSKFPSQCKRCQEWCHTRNYCSKPFKCVKCGKGHPTEECVKPREAPAKCANCEGEHTANYRGCPVAAEAAHRHKNVPLKGQETTSSQKKSIKPKFVPKKPIICNQKPTQKMTQQASDLRSYANVLKNQKSATQGPSRRQSVDPTNEMQSKIDQIFEIVMNLSKSVSTLNERVGKIESNRPKKAA